MAAATNDVKWFPMRVTYQREMKVKNFLESQGIECFLPMKERISKNGGRIIKEYVPAISNLIFVHSSQSVITQIKQTTAEGQPLRYMMRPHLDKDMPSEIITVCDRDMANFIHVATGPSDMITYLSSDELKAKINSRVVITSGAFKGVEGVLKRINGNKHVVVELEGIGGICINFIPKDFMIKREAD